jgi:hypothetical protein
MGSAHGNCTSRFGCELLMLEDPHHEYEEAVLTVTKILWYEQFGSTIASVG